jgi:hypothetical protein
MQEFAKQDNGERLLTIDDMIVELMLTDWIQKGVVTRTTRKTDFSFDPLPDERFKKKNPMQFEAGSDNRSDDFWAQHRQVEFTKSEAGMGGFLDHLEKLKGFKYAIFVLKALFENYLETGTRQQPSKFDVGPVNTVVSQNFYDGIRWRLSGQTTANLHPHLFLKGYYAYGTQTRNHYYDAVLTYALDRKKYLPQAERESKLEHLRKLDASVGTRALIASMVLGILSALVFGVGMCCFLVWSLWVLGALLCVIGVVGMLVAPWLYRKLVEKRKAEIAPEILRLTEELSQK